jgi:hypothetical protein
MSDKSDNPAKQLTDRVVQRLLDAKLIRAPRAAKISDQILSGKMAGDDWRLELELAKGKTEE